MNELISTMDTADTTTPAVAAEQTITQPSLTRTITLWLRRAGPSLGFLGYFPVASGTVGSAVTIVALWFAHRAFPAFFTPAYALHYWLAIVCVTALSILLSKNPKYLFGKSDPKQIIIDEFAGQFITFFMVGISWRTLLLGFLLFRFFDIIKPFPVHSMEEIDDSVGVVMDDVVAGVFANISLIAILWLYHLIRTALNS